MYSRTLVLRFPKEIVDKPIISNLVRDYPGFQYPEGPDISSKRGNAGNGTARQRR